MNEKNVAMSKEELAVLKEEVNEGLANFLINEIGSGVHDGITYALFCNDIESNKEKIVRYNELAKKAAQLGIKFLMLQVSNGVIFDLDIAVAKNISIYLKKVVEKNGLLEKAGAADDAVGDGPDRRRAEDVRSLGEYIVKKAKETKADSFNLKVALYSRNKVDRIVYNAVGKDKKNVTVTYKAFAIRHWDIQNLNKIFLNPRGYSIVNVHVYEILPTRTGVSFEFTVKRI